MRNFTSLKDLFEMCDAIGFQSIQVVNEQGETVVNGAATKNPWEKNKTEVAKFLSKAEKPYQLKVRKGIKGAPEIWQYTPGENSNENYQIADSKPAAGGITIAQYTKVLAEKYAAETEAQIAKAEILVLKKELEKFTGEISEEIEEEEEPSLSERAVTLFEENKGAIQPVIQTLADMAMGFLNGNSASKDDATAHSLQLVIKKLQGHPLTDFELQIAAQNYQTFGPKTQSILGPIFSGQ